MMSKSPNSGIRTPQDLISPQPSPVPQNISTEINTATRGVHARLNKLIVTRLPFSLPPHSSGPELYAVGINQFAQIYLTFEANWHAFIEKATADRSSLSAHEEKVQIWLADLIPSGLWRTKAIRSDLSHLSKALDIKLDGADAAVSRDQALIKHIQEVTTEKPHTYIAYAWIMYMAIFSGGRWIRQQLLEAGPGFWHVQDSEAAETTFGKSDQPVPGFSLFYFEGERDGEDIKADFKARLELAERLLSQRQRDEVCEEAQFIFNACIGLVEKLDDELATASKAPTSDQEAALAKAKAGHTVSTVVPSTTSTSHGPIRALGAIFLALLFWYVWLSTAA